MRRRWWMPVSRLPLELCFSPHTAAAAVVDMIGSAAVAAYLVVNGVVNDPQCVSGRGRRGDKRRCLCGRTFASSNG